MLPTTHDREVRMFAVQVKSTFGDIVSHIRPFVSTDGKIEYLKLKAILRIMEHGRMPESCAGADFAEVLTDMSKVDNAMIDLENQKREFYREKRTHDQNVIALEERLKSADHVAITQENDRLKKLNQSLRDEVDSSRSDATTLRADNNRLKSEIAGLQEEIRMLRTAAMIRGNVQPRTIVSGNDMGNAIAQGQWSTAPTPQTVIVPATPAPAATHTPTPAGNTLEID